MKYTGQRRKKEERIKYVRSPALIYDKGFLDVHSIFMVNLVFTVHILIFFFKFKNLNYRCVLNYLDMTCIKFRLI